MDISNHHRVKPYLLTRSLLPENQETPIQLIKNDIMDNKLFYEMVQLAKGIGRAYHYEPYLNFLELKKE